jgi:hypothetical protein
MEPWREAALSEIAALKPHWVAKHSWGPRTVEREDAIDLYTSFRGTRLGEREREHVLRLRYRPDWQVAGRRETFVDPEQPEREGREFWPAEGAVRGVNPNYRIDGQVAFTPCICLRGAWGYHSVLHSNESAEGSSLLGLLLELQEVIDE